MPKFTETELWDFEDPIRGHDVDVPDWIDQDISGTDISAIVQGGCASGAYMPAVTYWQAKEIMSDHGDDVLNYIEDAMGETPRPPEGASWSSIAVFYLSVAVELWAASVHTELTE